MERSLRELGGEFHTFRYKGALVPVLIFFCPICPSEHGIVVGYAPPSLYDSGAVWSKTGDTIDNVSIIPSINCDIPGDDGKPSSCKFHGWVRNGKVSW